MSWLFYLQLQVVFLQSSVHALDCCGGPVTMNIRLWLNRTILFHQVSLIKVSKALANLQEIIYDSLVLFIRSEGRDLAR